GDDDPRGPGWNAGAGQRGEGLFSAAWPVGDFPGRGPAASRDPPPIGRRGKPGIERAAASSARAGGRRTGRPDRASDQELRRADRPACTPPQKTRQETNGSPRLDDRPRGPRDAILRWRISPRL